MVVGDLDIVRSAIAPDEADSVLVVDPDGVLSSAITDQLLQTIPRWHSESHQLCGGVQEPELLLGRPLKVGSECRYAFAVPDPLRLAIPEGPDHLAIVLRNDSMRKVMEGDGQSIASRNAMTSSSVSPGMPPGEGPGALARIASSGTLGLDSGPVNGSGADSTEASVIWASLP